MDKLHFLKTIWRKNILTDAEYEEVISELKIHDTISIPISRGLIRQFIAAKPIGKQAVDVVMALFQIRDNRLNSTHNQINGQHQDFVPWDTTVFATVEFFERLREDPEITIDNLGLCCFTTLEVQRVKGLFLPLFHATNHYLLIKIDIIDHHIGIIDLLHEFDPINLENLCISVETTLFPFLQRNFGHDIQWTCGLLSLPYLDNRHEFYQIDNATSNISAIAMAAVLFFMVHESPVFLEAKSLENFRSLLAYWILQGELPI